MSAGLFPAENPLTAWLDMMDRLRRGEDIPRDQWVDPPPIELGMILRSGRTRYPDSLMGVGVGGVYWSPGQPDGWNVVEQWRGAIHWHTIAPDDLDWTQYVGSINLGVLRDLRVALAQDMVKTRHDNRHLAALLVIGRCLS